MPEKFRDNRERAFAEYFSRRKENADALAYLAVDNFIEMRDKTASRLRQPYHSNNLDDRADPLFPLITD